MQPQSCGPDSFFTVMETVLYECVPYLHRKGAHVWIEEVSRQRFVVGFTCWEASERGALKTWLDDQLRRVVTDRVYRGITVQDFSDFRPVASRPRGVAMTA